MGETLHVEVEPGVRIAYDDVGRGEPVVLVHGLGSSRRRWRPLRDPLREAGYRVITFDLRGFGESDPPPAPYDVATLAADMRVVTGACGVGAHHLVGHSLGGMVAQHHAVGHPESLRTLSLVSTTSHNGRRASAFSHAMAVVSERGFDAASRDAQVRGRLESLLAEAFKGAAPPLDMFRRGLERPNPAQASAWRATAGFSVKDRLGDLRLPVMVVHGTADPVIPVIMGQLIHRAIEGSKLHLLEGVGHHPHREERDAFVARLVDFLSRGERPGGSA